MSSASVNDKARNLYDLLSVDIENAEHRFENPNYGFESVGIQHYGGSTDAVLTFGANNFSHLGFVSVGLDKSLHTAADVAIELRAASTSVDVMKFRHFAGTLLLGSEAGMVFSVEYIERSRDFVNAHNSKLMRDSIIPQIDSVMSYQGITFRGLLSYTEYFVYDSNGLTLHKVPKGARIRNGFIHGEAVSPTETVRQQLAYDSYAFQFDLNPEERAIFESMAEEYFRGGKPCNYEKLCKGIIAAKRP